MRGLVRAVEPKTSAVQHQFADSRGFRTPTVTTE